jgi:hypothetical protein
MITKLLVPLLVLGSVAGEAGPDSSNLRGRDLASLKKVCIYLGRDFGFQTFEVPFDKYRFYTSSSRIFPAEPGECHPDKVKELSTKDLQIKKFCRLFKHTANEWWTTEAISAATDWMIANEFETGSCTNKNTVGTLHMEHLKEVNDEWEVLYDELVDLLFNFTYGELVSLLRQATSPLFK